MPYRDCIIQSFNPRPPAEGDYFYFSWLRGLNSFNPRPPAEGDKCQEKSVWMIVCFNPRPPAEGDESVLKKSHLMTTFQSTPSCGGRHVQLPLGACNKQVSIHALLRRATVQG